MAVFLANTVAMLASYLVLLCNNVVAGRQFGEDALAAITLVTPFISLIAFFTTLISTGTEIMVSRSVGQEDWEKANHFFSQGILLSFIFGAGLSGVLWLISLLPGAFMGGASPAVSAYAAEYYGYVCLLPLPQILNGTLFCMLLCQGGEKRSLAGSFVQIVSNIALAILLSRSMGIAGISLAAVISSLLQLGISLPWFFKKECRFRFRPYMNMKDLFSVLQYSFSIASSQLFLSVLGFVTNAFLLHRFGSSAVAIFALVLNLLDLFISAFDGLGDGLSILVNVYQAENDQHGLRNSIEAALRTGFFEALLLSAGFFAAAPLVPSLFAIDDRTILVPCIFAVRIFSLAALPIAIMMTYSFYCLCLNHFVLSVSINLLYLLIMPTCAGILSGTLSGMTGQWIGFTAGFWLSAVPVWFLARHSAKGLSFPLLLDKNALRSQFSYDIPASEDALKTLLPVMEAELASTPLSSGTRENMMLMTEETCALIVEKNTGRKTKHKTFIEVTCFTDLPNKLIIRDSGLLKNAADPSDAPVSLLSYTASLLVHGMAGADMSYIPASGYNRYIFRYPEEKKG
ncbi:MAG: MATE family efflux transporter [Lachnospiraceae bacterium]|nr:MATE family efflux transporter [Lachnospiraceae bacterium]